MGYASKNINRKYLEEAIKSYEKRGVTNWGRAEVCARTSLYLDREDKAKDYFEKASYMIDTLIDICKDDDALYELSRAIHTKANFLRLAGEVEEAKVVYREAKEMYEQLLEENKYPYYRDVYMGRYLCTLFFLKEYEKCLTFGEEWEETYPVWLSRAILNNDKESIGKMIERTKRHAKEVRIGPGEESGSTTSIWDWYEIGMKLLGLPSRIDYIDW